MPAPEDIRRALAQVLASARFQRSRRARELLTYLVEETLAGRQEQLKAFSIAIDVFGKDETFDAENDTLVRVQAGRLRDLLARFYEGEEAAGADVRISLPRGSYVPQFAAFAGHGQEREASSLPVFARAETPPPQFIQPPSVEPASAVAAGRGMGILARPAFKAAAVLLVLGLGIWAALWRHVVPPVLQGEARPPVMRLVIAKSATDPVERALLQSVREIASRFKDFDTVTRDFTVNSGPVWPEDYRIRIENVALGETSAISLSAEHLATGTVVGSVRTGLTRTSDLRDLAVLERALVKLLQPFGPLYTDYQRRGDYSEVMRCVLLRHDYDLEQTDLGHTRARDCSETLIARGGEDPRNYLALAYMHMEEYTDQRNQRPGDPLKRAIQAASRALELAPASAEAHERLMTVYALTGDFDLMIASGRRAIELNPSNSSAMDNFGARLNYRGRHEEALQLLLKAESLQPVAPRWRAYAFFLALYGMGRLDEAAERASTLAGSRNPLYLAARAIVAKHRNDAVERNEALIALAQEERGFLSNPRAMYERRHYVAPLVDRLVRDLTGPALVSGVP